MTDTARETQEGLSRRTLLGRGAAVGAGKAKTPPGYGPLVADPAGRLSLPAGFSYRPGGNPVPHHAGLVYDEGAFGGTTNIEVDTHGNRIREYVSLAGTHNNCAGGRTPWNAASHYGTFVPDLSVTQVGTTYDVAWASVLDRDAGLVPTRKQFNVGAGTGAPGGTPPGAESSKALGGETTASTSSRRSPGTPTAVPPSTTGRCGGSTREKTQSRWCSRSPTPPGDQDNDPDGPTTSRSRRSEV